MDQEDDYLDDDLSLDGEQPWGGTLPCPDCGADIYEDAVRCPACGAYVSWDEAAGGRSARWDRLVKTGLLLLVIGVLGTAALTFLQMFSQRH